MDFFDTIFLNQSFFSCRQENVVVFEEERQVLFNKFRRVRTKGKADSNNNSKHNNVKSKRRVKKSTTTKSKGEEGSSKISDDSKFILDSDVNSKTTTKISSNSKKDYNSNSGSSTKTKTSIVVDSDVVSSHLSSLVSTDSMLPADLMPSTLREQETFLEFFSPCHHHHAVSEEKNTAWKESGPAAVEMTTATSTSDDKTTTNTTSSENIIITPPQVNLDDDSLQRPSSCSKEEENEDGCTSLPYKQILQDPLLPSSKLHCYSIKEEEVGSMSSCSSTEEDSASLSAGFSSADDDSSFASSIPLLQVASITFSSTVDNGDKNHHSLDKLLQEDSSIDGSDIYDTNLDLDNIDERLLPALDDEIQSVSGKAGSFLSSCRKGSNEMIDCDSYKAELTTSLSGLSNYATNVVVEFRNTITSTMETLRAIDGGIDDNALEVEGRRSKEILKVLQGRQQSNRKRQQQHDSYGDYIQHHCVEDASTQTIPGGPKSSHGNIDGGCIGRSHEEGDVSLPICHGSRNVYATRSKSGAEDAPFESILDPMPMLKANDDESDESNEYVRVTDLNYVLLSDLIPQALSSGTSNNLVRTGGHLLKASCADPDTCITGAMEKGEVSVDNAGEQSNDTDPSFVEIGRLATTGLRDLEQFMDDLNNDDILEEKDFPYDEFDDETIATSVIQSELQIVDDLVQFGLDWLPSYALEGSRKTDSENRKARNCAPI